MQAAITPIANIVLTGLCSARRDEFADDLQRRSRLARNGVDLDVAARFDQVVEYRSAEQAFPQRRLLFADDIFDTFRDRA